ncbi:RNA 3'-terminal phosphate cyclase [candidate division CSSED10-310 bacterium]|uniref:RNA 3'-terminal phosphate cyclase n=1 Tax=candidate division CSSED10-310 bacterium TaxID=2855610 RepID=A0ABV6YZ52_UNCC1
MLIIDGSFGEGGGQILRTSLTMSLITGKAIRIKSIRAKRKKPGLLRQHLTALNAAAEIGQAVVKGNNLGSQEIYFSPGPVKSGSYNFSIGTAGSCTLVLQTILPPLCISDKPSTLTLEGGTHNPFAPPYEFINSSFLPLLNRMGPKVTACLDRAGFYPAGGGKITVSIEPVEVLSRIELSDRGRITEQSATAIVAHLPLHIARRELKVIRHKLALKNDCLHSQELKNSLGPGNVLLVTIKSEHVAEVFTGFGARGVTAEQVARKTATEVLEYVSSEVPVGKHLADQLLVPMALCGGGLFRTFSPTQHTRTNMAVIEQFLDLKIGLKKLDDTIYEISIPA